MMNFIELNVGGNRDLNIWVNGLNYYPLITRSCIIVKYFLHTREISYLHIFDLVSEGDII